MSEWQKQKISDFCDITRGGSPRPIQDYLSSSGTPWVKISDATASNNRYISSTKEFIKVEGESKSRVVNPGDFILSNSATPGLPRFMKIRACVHDGWLLIRNIKGVDELFLYYLLLTEREALLVQGNGSIFTNLKTEILKEHIVNLPPLEEQKAIASVLSSLDDKIDLLHRQNTTLERMAETLFRQWFVEEAQEDWEEKPLSFYGEIVCGKTPSKQNHSYFNGDVPFIKIPDMHGNPFIFKTEDTLTELGKSSQNNKTVPPYSICVSCIATVGLVSITTKPSQTNQQINTIVPCHSKYRYFLYLTMKASYDLLHAEASGGTATLNLNTGNFSRITVPLPPDSLLLEFESIVDKVFNKIYQNQAQIQTLEKLRDNLLPKLMSGEVRVS